jgi:DNA-binding response OmpR family regulator
MRLLLVEDSHRLRASLTRALTRLGHGVDAVSGAEEADVLVRANPYEAIVLDLMLPGRSGLDILTHWRRAGHATPVIILTALSAVEDRVRGLAAGADDYLTKPFAIEELAARLEAVVRRCNAQPSSALVVGGVEIDLARRVVRRDGQAVNLTAREFSLLECLARRPGAVISREQIEAHLYGEADSPLSNAVDAAVYSLRQKLCPKGTPQLLQTQRGLGYSFGPP